MTDDISLAVQETCRVRSLCAAIHPAPKELAGERSTAYLTGEKVKWLRTWLNNVGIAEHVDVIADIFKRAAVWIRT